MAQLYREENIKALASAIEGDMYNDEQQIEAWGEDPPETIAFLNRNLADSIKGLHSRPAWLEIGCGSGRLLGKLICNPMWMMDPSQDMLARLSKRLNRELPEGFGIKDIPLMIHGYIECIPPQVPYGLVDAVVFMNGFFQVRSDYEALIEVNKALRVGGRFLFNLLSDDSQDIICGRVLGQMNYIRLAEEFGFRLVERRKDGNIALEKEHDFYPEKLRKLQLKKVVVKSDAKDPKYSVTQDLYVALNLDPIRDRKFT